MLSAVNKLTFILSEAGISVSLSPSVPPFPCNEPCQERSGVALIGQEGTGGSRTLLTGWEGGSWLPAQPVTACSANLEMLLAEVWSPWPHSFPLCSGEDPRSLLESCSAEWCSVFLSSYHRAFFHFLWAVSVVSAPSALIPYSPKIMAIRRLTWGPHPEAAELFSNSGLVWTSCLFFHSKELESLCLGSSWSLPN